MRGLHDCPLKSGTPKGDCPFPFPEVRSRSNAALLEWPRALSRGFLVGDRAQIMCRSRPVNRLRLPGIVLVSLGDAKTSQIATFDAPIERVSRL